MTTLESLDNMKQSFLRGGGHMHCDVSEPSVEPAKEITQTQLKSLMRPIFQIAEYNHQDTSITNPNTTVLTTKKHVLQTELTCSSKKQKKNEELSLQSEDSSKINPACGNGKNFSRIVSTEMKKNSPKFPTSPQGSPPRAGSPTNVTTVVATSVVATSVSHTCAPAECLKKKKRKEIDKPLAMERETVKKPYASKSSDKLSSCIQTQDKICLRVCGLNKGKYDGKFETHSFPITATIEDLQSLIEKSRCNENEKISYVVRTVWNNDMMIPKKIELNTLLLTDSHNSTWELQLQANQIVLNRIA